VESSSEARIALAIGSPNFDCLLNLGGTLLARRSVFPSVQYSIHSTGRVPEGPLFGGKTIGNRGTGRSGYKNGKTVFNQRKDLGSRKLRKMNFRNPRKMSSRGMEFLPFGQSEGWPTPPNPKLLAGKPRGRPMKRRRRKLGFAQQKLPFTGDCPYPKRGAD